MFKGVDFRARMRFRDIGFHDFQEILGKAMPNQPALRLGVLTLSGWREVIDYVANGARCRPVNRLAWFKVSAHWARLDAPSKSFRNTGNVGELW